MLSNLINFSIHWKNNTDPEDGHTKKTHFCRTVSQSSIHVSERKHDNTNLLLSQGSKPTFRSIERSVIPFKCSRGMQVFMDNSNRYTQTPQD